MAKTRTHNIVEYSEGLLGVHAYMHATEAQEMFAEIAKENGFSDADIEFGLEEGWLKRDNYELYLAESE